MKRYHLKKNVVIIIRISIILLFFIIILKNNYLRTNLNKTGSKYVKRNFILSKIYDNENINNEKNVSNSDDVFKIKETVNSDYLVYLYNTHQTESYSRDVNILYDPTIMRATLYLKEQLGNYGINAHFEDRSISDVLTKNKWNYASSYKASRYFLEDTIINYPTIKYFFDIHRDSGSYNSTTLCVDDACYAKILFVIGLENANHDQNYKMALKLNDKLNNRLSGLSRGIIGKEGKGVNGVYNQDFSQNLLLIEIGGENNHISEVFRSIDILTEVLSEYIKEDNI